MADSQHRVAIIYGPVGYIVQKPGEKPRIEMRDQWKHVEEDINAAIDQGSEFVDPSFLLHEMTNQPLDDSRLIALDIALTVSSGGDLFAKRILEQT